MPQMRPEINLINVDSPEYQLRIKTSLLNLAQDISKATSNGTPVSQNQLSSYLDLLQNLIPLPKETAKRTLSDEIREWILSTDGVFLSTDVAREMDLSTRVHKKNLSAILARLVKEGMIAKHGDRRGQFRVIDRSMAPMNWQDADVDNTVDLILTLGLHKLMKLYPKNIIVVAGDTNAGKGHPDGTPFLTLSGWRNIETLQIGDSIYGRDGKLTTITGIFPRGPQQTFRIHFNDHTSVICDFEHLWTVKGQNRSGHEKEWETVPTYSLLNQYYLNKITVGQRKHKIPLAGIIQFPAREIPLNPYMLGVLLGDGCLSKGSVTITCNDPEIILEIKKTNLVIKSGNRTQSYGVFGLMPALKALGLKNKHSWEKFIPQDYLLNSPENRIAILQGLMDTNGTISLHGKTISFTSTSKQLTEDVAFLVRSLGGKASFGKERRTQYRHNGEYKKGRESYRIQITMNGLSPFRLTRKAKLLKPFIKTLNKVITNIENTGIQPTTCISVANPDGLYITQDFIVTHNTAYLLNLVRENGEKFQINYFTNDLTPEELKIRVARFAEAGMNTDAFAACNFIPRIGNFLDVINPDGITIIDYLKLTDKFWLVAQEIDKIYERLQKGVAIIAIQKDKNTTMGRGGDFAAEAARLYLTLEEGRANVIKMKNLIDPEKNPNGKSVKFKLWAGCKFIPDMNKGWHDTPKKYGGPGKKAKNEQPEPQRQPGDDDDLPF